jgi:tRNA modification GTPase
VIVVRSKADLPSPLADDVDARGAVVVSSMTGDGLDHLLDRLAQHVTDVAGDAAAESAIAASLRQCAALERIGMLLGSAGKALRGVPLEVALVDLREALEEASALLGVEVGEAVLDRIFSTFCIGK